MIEVAGPPSRWIVQGGRPSDVCWDDHNGIPSYESDTGKILVFDLLVAADMVRSVANATGALLGKRTMLVPVGYRMCAARSVAGDHELCALHDDPDALWVWRPLLYQIERGLTRLGSQQELEWRWSLQEMSAWQDDVDAATAEFIVGQVLSLRRRYGRIPPVSLEPGQTGFRLPKNARKRMWREYAAALAEFNAGPLTLPYMEANERADAILREHLCPQQRLDLEAHGSFYVRGTVNRLYHIELGNGMQIVDPETRQPRVSLCLHPERWMPHADVALAQKLAIESGPEREAEMLEGARPRVLDQRARPTRDDRAAWERERYLYPEPLTPA